jgi:threonine dehydrogenase-like Zn-dependent dehydrogenase
VQALYFDGEPVFLTDLPRPSPLAGEVLIRVRLAGICNTDLEILRGYKGFVGILGHEFVGDVVESPDDAWVDRRVCGEINIPCRTCELCTSGLPNHCIQRAAIGIHGRDGAFADYLALPRNNLHPVPEELGDEDAVFVEPVAAAFEILKQVSLKAQHSVAVLGDGKLGLLCAQALLTTGAEILLVGKHDRKLMVAHSLNIPAVKASEVVGQTFDVVVEATGSPDGLEAAIRFTRARGTLVLKSTFAGRPNIDVSHLVVNEVTLVGSRCGPFAHAVEALRTGTVRVAPLIDARYALCDGIAALECAASGALKVLIRP